MSLRHDRPISRVALRTDVDLLAPATLFGMITRAFVLSLIAGLMGCAAAPSGTPASANNASQQRAAARWNEAALQEVLAYARAQKTTGLLIIEDRQIIVEHNWPLPDDADSGKFREAFVHGQAPDGSLLEDVASQQKSFIAILVAVAIDQGLVDVERPVAFYIGVGWSKSPSTEARITVRHLLEMTSGLTEELGFQFEPGTRFFYNTPAYAVTKRVLESASKRSLEDLTALWLTQPLGMNQTAWRQRPPALTVPGNPTGLVTTPRDVAKMGQLVLDRGLAPDGRRVISTAQLDLMLQRTSTNPAYARLWWVNGGSYTLRYGAEIARVEGPLVPSAPADMVLALGAMDRTLFVVPSRRLIVVRTGQATPARDFSEQLWSRLTKALPRGG